MEKTKIKCDISPSLAEVVVLGTCVRPKIFFNCELATVKATAEIKPTEAGSDINDTTNPVEEKSNYIREIN